MDYDKKQFKLSAILDFYTEDLGDSGRAADLPAYVNRYRKKALPKGYKVRFIKHALKQSERQLHHNMTDAALWISNRRS